MPTLALISCGKSKGPIAAPARFLYTGTMFQKSLMLAERYCDRSCVLSAKHGLIELDDIIAPYEMTLNKMSRAARAQWARNVSAVMSERYNGWEYIYFTGSVYMNGLPPGEDPMHGLGFGRRLAWLNEQLAKDAT